MGRAIVAINAIHSANFMLRRIALKIRCSIFSDLSGRIGKSDPWDDLPLSIGGDVFDLVREIHVPVNPTGLTVCRVTAPHIKRESYGKSRIRFIGQIMLVRPIELADISVRP